MPKYTEDDLKIELETKEYKYGFTELEADTFPIGLNEDIVRAISMRKEEPQWMTDWRIESFRALAGNTKCTVVQKVDPNKTLDDVDPELLEM
jgi:Fe-S cluster assembly protein SufB